MIPSVWTRWIWLALIALQVAWFGVLYPPQALPMALVLTVMLLPLLAPLPWILKLRPQALVFGGLVLLLHFSVAVAEAWTKPGLRWIGWLQILLIVSYYLALPGLRRQRAEPEDAER